MAEAFRTCPTTGLKVHLPAENLIKANAVAAVVFLAVGGLFGLLVALTRWPAVHLLPADWFYLALTAHGLDVLLVWIIFFEMAILYFASAVLLNCRLATPRIAWAGFALMLAGAVIVNVAVLQGQSTVMFTSYVPMKAAPHFYLGLLLFAVGALTQPRLHELPGYLRHQCRGRPRVGRAHHPCAMVRGGHHAELSPLRLRRAGAGGDAPPAARVPARPDARRPVARLVHRRPAPVAVLFAAGVSGYWVVWDELAQYVAVATTEWLDTLPLFGEPIARNFLHPSTLGSRFFTLLVFIHIFVPLAMLFVISPRCASR